jgi:acyl carrier protein
MNQQNIQQKLADFLRQHAEIEEFDSTTDLIDEGILDSLMVTDLVLFSQQQFGIELAARDISPENLGTIEGMTRLICGKQEKLRRAA